VRAAEEAQARQRAKENAAQAWSDPDVVGRACTSLGLCFKALANLSFMNDALAREVSNLLLAELSTRAPLRTRIPEQAPPKALVGHKVVISDTNYKVRVTFPAAPHRTTPPTTYHTTSHHTNPVLSLQPDAAPLTVVTLTLTLTRVCVLVCTAAQREAYEHRGQEHPILLVLHRWLVHLRGRQWQQWGGDEQWQWYKPQPRGYGSRVWACQWPCTYRRRRRRTETQHRRYY